VVRSAPDRDSLSRMRRVARGQRCDCSKCAWHVVGQVDDHERNPNIAATGTPLLSSAYSADIFVGTARFRVVYGYFGLTVFHL